MMCLPCCVQNVGSIWSGVSDAAMWLLFGFGIGVLLGMRAPRTRAPRGSPSAAGSGGLGVEIYAGNLSYELTEDDLRKEFEAYGVVSDVRIISNKFNNKSKGYGFVKMPDGPEAQAAIAALNGKNLKGREIVVNEAKSKTKRDDR